jgi:O-antigen ligase
MALIVGWIIFASGLISLRATRMILMGSWAFAVILAVPLSSLPYTLRWQDLPWLSSSSSIVDRINIWKFTADKVYERPIAGIGIRSARTLDSKSVFTRERREKKFGARPRINAPHPGWHPHNVYLQTWLELGAIGAALLLAVGIAALWQLQHLNPLFERAGYALFAICGAVGVSGFDLWQTWLLATLALAWTAMLLASYLPTKASS